MYSFSYFLDADYIIKDEKTYVRLLLKRDGKKFYKYFQYDPYFYAEPKNKELIEKLVIKKKKEFIRIKRIEEVKKKIGFEEKKFYKIYCNKPSDIKIIRDFITNKTYEYDIPFRKRFVIDFKLEPFSIIEYEYEGEVIKKILSSYPSSIKLEKMAFDIETYNKNLSSNPKKDPIIMISYSDGNARIITYKKTDLEYVDTVKDEKEMLLHFFEVLSKKNPDVLFGYNSTNFDLPYIKERCKKLKINLKIGSDGKYKKLRKGRISGLKLNQIIHIDLYPVSLFFSGIGAIKTQRYTLDEVASSVIGEHKKNIDKNEIWRLWDENDDKIYEYSKKDAQITYELGSKYLPLLKEIAHVSKTPLFETSLSTSGQLVENLLMFNAPYLIPPKPSGMAVLERQNDKIEGAYVKMPEPGIYENIVVFDFRSLYPSIIISYNIDPYTLDPKGHFISPTGARFLKEPIGLIPKTLKSLIELRTKLKKKLKLLKKGSKEYEELFPRVQALKILANSFYGYLGYSRSRWYNRACAESVTALARKHIKEAEKIAEKEGFNVLYIDTDSLFLLLGNKTKKDALKLLEKINKTLPGTMELELESFYKRGLFVSKKSAKEGAKKKYALLDEDGRIKIRGFELVRRDWSNIAKKTQKKVLEIILKEGNKEKAVNLVKEVINKLKKGEIPLEDLIIYTHLTKKLEDYEVKSPELVAAKKAIKRGIPLENGSIVGYIITKNGANISDKAEYYKFAKNYDPNYYINHQVLPAVMKILKELNYDKNLEEKGKQKGLSDFF